MRRIISVDSCVLNHNAEKVFDAISDVTVYKDWWSSNVKVKVIVETENRVGSKVEIRASGGWFRCEITSLIPPNEIRVKYYYGVQVGEGIWSIEKTGANESVVTYSIDLEPVGFMAKLLSNFMNLSKMHSKSMVECFKV
jgi:ribosome-associated toxin RatA of RatAB toxin-antitoxin module